ncbi:dimethylamine monooxygenase subunit DmmA family protein [Cryobacterium luteum]|uniref:Dimethylamine monooxygenase subunit DmmA-like C-terminal domain-containing protein n=1 Tax=Cryobacterium luteum TaxID=1424661 RepID=A0A1H8K8H4_9MICO|nr:dimethylamine monooxygenase subunit DmmA family protein [Cryobacterium luteum]TFB92375.1 hypothetical protein E3O10_04870 [Cryobacterium luteum]SEN89224.1 hypothetical protein SAMN05216281_11811 [Cryobacterium luteum]
MTAGTAVLATATTSVPRAATSSAYTISLLVAARECIVYCFGTAAPAAASTTWPRASAPAALWREFTAPRADRSALTHIGTLLSTAHVGVRLLLAGPETDVYQARSQALACGALDEEIALCTTDRSTLRVHCAHCKTVTETAQPIGGVVSCAGCDRSLLTYHHFSRRSTAYLGFMVDAEEAQ